MASILLKIEFIYQNNQIYDNADKKRVLIDFYYKNAVIFQKGYNQIGIKNCKLIKMLTQSMIEKFTKKFQEMPKNPKKQEILDDNDHEDSGQYFPPSFEERNSKENQSKSHEENYENQIPMEESCSDDMDDRKNTYKSNQLQKKQDSLYMPSKLDISDDDLYQKKASKNKKITEIPIDSEQQSESQPKPKNYTSSILHHQNQKQDQFSSSFLKKQLKQKMKSLLFGEPKHTEQNKKNSEAQKFTSLNDEIDNRPVMNDGRNCTQSFKREFILNLFKKISKMNSQAEENEAIKMASRKVSVYPYEIKLWMVGYQIILKIQQKYGKNDRQNNQVDAKQKIIEHQLFKYLKKNPSQKKYRVIKIINHVTKVLKLYEIRAKQLLKDLLQKNRNELANVDLCSMQLSSPDGQNQQIQGQQISEEEECSKKNGRLKKKKQSNGNLKKNDDFSVSYNEEQENSTIRNRSRRSSKKVSYDEQINIDSSESYGNQQKYKEQEQQISDPLDFLDDYKNDKNYKKPKKNKQKIITNKRKAKQIEKNKPIRQDVNTKLSQEISQFPQFFKQNVASKLDEVFRKSFSQIIDAKAQQMCIPKSILRQIYSSYGTIQVFDKNGAIINENKNKLKIQNPREDEDYLQSLKVNTHGKKQTRSRNKDQDDDKKNGNRLSKSNNKNGTAVSYGAYNNNERTKSLKKGDQKNKDQLLQTDNHMTKKIKLKNIPTNSNSTPNLNQNINYDALKVLTKAKKSAQGTIPYKPQKPPIEAKKKTSQQLFTDLETHLSNYLQTTPNYQLKQLEYQTDMFMSRNKFSINMKNQVRSKWFAYFIRKYGVKLPPNITKKNR